MAARPGPHARLNRGSCWAFVVTGLAMCLSPVSSLAQGAAPSAAVDCDQFADGVQVAPIVVVTSPVPGASIPAENVTIQGFAADCHVDVGAGINRVSIFLGSRDAGGIFLGDAALRKPSPIAVLPADQYQASAGWAFAAPAPLKPGELNELFVYARSELTNVETSVKLPVMGAGPARAAALTPSAAPAPAPVPAPTPAPPPPTVEAPTVEPVPAVDPEPPPPADDAAEP